MDQFAKAPADQFAKASADQFDRLLAAVVERREGDPASSYVAKLTAKGRAKIAQKLGEEAVETVIAAMQDDRVALVGEATDLIFHLAVLLADAGLTFDDLRTELLRREGVSGLAEKAGRKP
ncbi:phosphoribosyl-ATP diphosphatase [Polymorphobacter sp. PAMC 29334]|uniref:phosphoribosyl-ATP diphosphatase n=1 Tax=Polymorphobacter sp. PAMC 29334 TaxID=2862331 RepID=UPI001C7933B6|nr:phosphoribosyl-ATP diphosphatase [Polymorphobacter sp. PAMC 29334]QYE35470.1 phosphoribosyl-ATP diphosphatase [Polymorphobacter sp. PAMC 29334]